MNHLSSSHKKFATAAIAAALVTTAAIPASAASFSDVSDRYEEAVKFLVENQIAEGLSASSFGTGQSIKRVDTAIMLAKALELDTTKVASSGFTDVPVRAKSYVDALKAAKIVDGKTATSFAVNQELTRGEAALMLVKAYGLPAAKTKVTLTDVSSRYEAAVAALLENKITSGKTATTFGTQQPITRGEFAVFIHRLENLQKEAAPSSVTVKNETELKAAITSKTINKITLAENVTVKELPTITHYLQLDLNGKTLTADLNYEMAEEQKEISLVSSKANGKLQGNLTVNVPKADFVVGEGVEVAGTAVIVNVKENTFHNKGTLNAVDIQDSDGTSFENHGQGAIKGDVSINTIGEVKLIGKVDSVEVNQAAKITVDAAATIAKLNVKVDNVVLNAPKGSVGKVEASAGVVVKDSTGTQVETNPSVQPVPEYTSPSAAITVTKLISDYEKLQQAFIESDPKNEQRYLAYEKLLKARKLLEDKLKQKVMVDREKELLKNIENKLDTYLVESYEPHVTEFDGQFDLWPSSVGVEIEWSSSNPEAVNNEGVITKPAKGKEAIEVILTAKVTRNEVTRVIDIPVRIEPETNPYAKTKSSSFQELAEYSKINGYIGTQVKIEFNLEELMIDYPKAQHVEIQIGNEIVVRKLINDIKNESTVVFTDELTISSHFTMNSQSVFIKLMDVEGNELETFTNSIRVYHFYPDANASLYDERDTLTVDSLGKYLPQGNDYSQEEKLTIIERFKEVPVQYDVLIELQKIAREVKEI